MNKPMATESLSLTELPVWQALQAHYRLLHPLHLRQLFSDDRKRGERFAAEACGLYLDYSKNPITAETMGLQLQLADACNLRGRIDAMFSGATINVTEQRIVCLKVIDPLIRCWPNT